HSSPFNVAGLFVPSRRTSCPKFVRSLPRLPSPPSRWLEPASSHCDAPRMSSYPTVALNFERRSEVEMQQRAEQLGALMDRRRSVREFSSDPVPLEVLHAAIRTAGTAPSGAHMQPWH